MSVLLWQGVLAVAFLSPPTRWQQTEDQAEVLSPLLFFFWSQELQLSEWDCNLIFLTHFLRLCFGLNSTKCSAGSSHFMLFAGCGVFGCCFAEHFVVLLIYHD